MKAIDQVERLTRSVNFMQGVEAPAPLESDGDKDARIAALEAKVNELVASIEQLSTGPDVDIQEGDELQPLLGEKSFIGQDPISVDDLGETVIIKLATTEDVIEDDSGGSGENHNLLDGNVHSDSSSGSPTLGSLISGNGDTWVEFGKGADLSVLYSSASVGLAWTSQPTASSFLRANAGLTGLLWQDKGAGASFLKMDADAADFGWFDKGAAGSVLNVNSGGTDLTWFGTGSPYEIMSTNGAGNGLDWLSLGSADTYLMSTGAGSQPTWTGPGVTGTFKALDPSNPFNYDSGSHTLKANTLSVTVTKGVVTSIGTASEETVMTFTSTSALSDVGATSSHLTKTDMTIYAAGSDSGSTSNYEDITECSD